MRDLPWRRTRDPWAVLVSEVMLQQTQVPRVVTIWHAFMARFPTVRECAEASQADVVRGVGGARLQPPCGQPPSRCGAHGRRSAA